MKVALGVLALGAVGWTSTAMADGQDDYYIQQAQQRYFDQAENARTFGMAGSAVVTSSDSSSVIGNPAGLGFMKGGDASFSYGRNEVSGNEVPSWNKIDQDTDYGAGLFAFPLIPQLDELPVAGNLGLGWNGYHAETDDAIDTDAYYSAVHAAYAKAIDENLSLGYGLSWYHNNLQSDLFDYTMDDGFRHTFGAQFRDEALKVGADFFFAHGSYDRTFKPVGDGGDSDVREHGFDVGLSYAVDRLTWFLSVDYENYETRGDLTRGPESIVVGGNESGDFFTPKVGLEYAFNDWLMGRAGYRYYSRERYFFGREDLQHLSNSAKSNAWSLGIGLNFPTHYHYIPAVRLDYGVEYRENAYDDWQHLVTLSMPFDLCMPA